MRVRVDSKIRVGASGIPPRMLERMRQALTLPNPAFMNRVRLGLAPGHVPETLCFVEEQPDEVLVPRGAIYTLRDLAEEEGVPLEIEDGRVLPPLPLAPVRPISLRDYQAAAVERLSKVTQGYVVLPCGAGKTRLALGAIERLRTPALVLVHTLDLAEQWRRALREDLGIEAGLIGDGTARVAPVTVAIVQALVHWTCAELDSLLARFGLLVVEEAHHTPSTTFRSIVDRSPARFRLGLTATPERPDGLGPLLDLFIGAPLSIVTHAELARQGVLVLPEIRVVETAFSYAYEDAQSFSPMLEALVRDEARNTLIVEMVRAEAVAGELCLVLTGRVDHALVLARELEAAGVRAGALTGTVKPSLRAERLAQARDGALGVLVATTLADEGLDLPRLSRVFLTFPSRARGRTMQRLGRLMRPHPEKKSAALLDFVDRRVPILRRHHVERRRLYSEVLGTTDQQPARPAETVAARSA